ncbi:MAG: LD-carboxypeptidase, partial [Bacillota bacterium]
MSPMLKPKHLKPGDRIALIAPSSPVEEDKLQLSVDSVNFLGLKPVLFPSAAMRHGYLSGIDQVRALDLNTAFADPGIDGIFCLRGGYGITRILKDLDYKMIAKNPKILLGYSDITGLHITLNQICNITTLHAPMPTRGWNSLDSVTLSSLTHNLFSAAQAGQAPVIEGEPIETIYPG